MPFSFSAFNIIIKSWTYRVAPCDSLCPLQQLLFDGGSVLHLHAAASSAPSGLGSASLTPKLVHEGGLPVLGLVCLLLLALILLLLPVGGKEKIIVTAYFLNSWIVVYVMWDVTARRELTLCPLKPLVHDKRLYGMGTSGGLLLIIPKWNLFVCEFPVSVRE